MADKKEEQKPSVLIDEEAQNPQFDDALLEQNLKTMKEANPSLHAILTKYKDFHANEGSTKED